MQIVPPIVVDEHGDVEVYPSVVSAIAAVEAIDIENNEYAFYDSTGRVLEAQVRKGKVSLTPTVRLESDSVALRGHIVRVLSLLGVPDAMVAGLSFAELSRLLLEKSGRQLRDRNV